MTSLETMEERLDKEFPPFTGVGAPFPMFKYTPNRNHILQFILSEIKSDRATLKEKVQNMKCRCHCEANIRLDRVIALISNEENE